ncbi:MAG: hypothetical protein Q4F27_00410 [Desulfovibrionaceae bacterium]|nr:hypothetical protein [Desulfovibrionaceae bacterium]
MKKIIISLGLALVLALASASAQAADNSAAANAASSNPAATNPVDQFTGKIWQATSANGKAAFLFGIESAITVEYFVNSKLTEKAAKDGKRPVYTLSPFEKGWMKAFKGVDRTEIIRLVDQWYAANPEGLSKPVLNVIWYELIVPRLAAQK